MGSDGETDLLTLNVNFDARYAGDQIYHLFFHPYLVDWSVGEYGQDHLDHIKEKKDVWYVGFGAMYLYHYVQERNIVTANLTNLSKTKGDFSDIRFTDDDGTTELDHWMKAGSGTSRTFWIEVKDNLGSNQEFYIYYGKADAASASNGLNTFIVFDEFTDGDYTNNPTWTVGAGTWDASNGYLKSQADVANCRITTPALTGGFYVTLNHYYENSTTTGNYYLIYIMDDAGNGYALLVNKGQAATYIGIWEMPAFEVLDNCANDGGGVNGAWHDCIYFSRDQNGNLEGIGHYGEKVNATDITTTAFTKLQIRDRAYTTSDDKRFDNIILRKYVSPEPTVGTAGSEEQPAAYYHGLKVQGVGELALCDVGSHPLRIRKGGTTYGIELVDTGDPNASAIRIKTPGGIKSLRKYT